MIGQTVSHYKILEKLGAGGMGVVYKAYDTTLKRQVALKFLPPDLTRDDNARKRFIHEAQAAAALDHPNICSVYEIGQSDGNTFIVMPLVDGNSLRGRYESGPLPLDEALDLTKQVARGLSKAHQSGIVHRDIKPGNILLTSDGHARIADFGLAKLSGQTKLTRTGMTVGTLAYMSPEQAQGSTVDGRSDVYSLGAVMYEALTGKPPFEGEHEAAVMYSIMNVTPEPLSTYRDDLPDNLQHVIDRALAKDLEDRYESADALIADLEAVQTGGYVAAPPRPRIRVKRSWTLAALVVVAAFVAGYIIQSLKPDSGRVREGISADVVAVFPFSYQGGPDYAYLENAVVDLIGDRFDGAGGLRVATATRADDPSDYARAAADAGAGSYVTGSIVEAGGNLNVTVTLVKTDSVQAVLQASGEGPDERLPEIMDGVAADLLAEFFSRPNERDTRVARETAGSFEAFKWYLVGEYHFRIGQITEAVEAFERAVKVDTTYAMGYFRMASVAQYSSPEGNKVAPALDRALRFSSDLPERDRLVIEGTHARAVQGDLNKSEQLCGTVLRRYPDDVDANMCIGEVLGAGFDAKGEGRDARSMFERVLSSIPDHYGALTEMVMILYGDPEESTKWFRRRLEVSPDGEYSGLDRMHLMYQLGEDSLKVGLTDLLRQHHDQIVVWAGSDAAVKFGQYDDAAEFFEILTESSRPARTRWRANMQLAHLEVARGRWSHVQKRTAAAMPLTLTPRDSAYVIELIAELCLVPLMAVPQQQLEELRRGLFDIERLYGDDWGWWTVAYNAYLSGMLSARLGYSETALRYAAVLDTVRPPIAKPRYEWRILYARENARCVRAEVALAKGDSATALTELSRTRQREYNIPFGDWNLYHGRAQLRYMSAGYARAMGDTEAAAEAYDKIGGSIWQVAYLPAKHLRLGELYEATGDKEKAAEHYNAFLDLWKNCDPELQPMVDDVQTRLADLNS